MDKPYLPQSTATKTTKILTAAGFSLYTLYLLSLIAGLAVAPIELLPRTILGILIFILLDIAFPLYALQKIYKTDVQNFKNLFYFAPATISSIGVIYLIPLALYNILLAIYFYIKLSDTDILEE